MKYPHSALLALTVYLIAGTPLFAAEGAEPLPEHIAIRLGSSCFRFAGTANDIRWFQEGKTICIGTDAQGRSNQMLQFMDAATGKTLKKFEVGHGTYDISPAGERVAVLNKGLLRIHDLAAGKVTQEFKVGFPVRKGPTFSPTGQELLIDEEDSFIHIDLNSGKMTKAAMPEGLTHLNRIGSIPGSDVVVAAETGNKENGKVGQVWVYQDGKWSCKIQPGNRASDHTLSPDGKLLAILIHAGEEDKKVYTLQVWSMETGKLIRKLTDLKNSVLLHFTPDGKYLVDTCAGLVWDIATGKESALPVSKLRGVVFSRDGRLAAFRGDAIHVLMTGSWREITKIDRIADKPLAFAPDGKTLALAGNNVVRRWSLDRDKELPLPEGGHVGALNSIMFSPDSKAVVTAASDGIRFWQPSTGKQLADFPNRPNVLMFSPDGKKLAAGWPNGTVTMMDPVTGKCQESFRADSNGIRTVHWCNQGRTLIGTESGGFLGQYRYFSLDVVTGKLLPLLDESKMSVTREEPRSWAMSCSPADFEMAGALRMALSPDERLLAIYRSGRIGIWELASGKLENELKPIPPPGIRGPHGGISLHFSPDGKYLIHAQRSILYSIDIESGKLACLLDNTEGVFSLAFTPDRKHIVWCSSGGQVHLQDYRTGKFLGTIANHRCSTPVAVSPDGKWLAMDAGDGTVNLWKYPEAFQNKEASSSEKDPAKLWPALADSDPALARPAQRQMEQLGDKGVAWIKEKVVPVAPLDAQHLQKLLANLGCDDCDARNQAVCELEALEELAEPALAKLLKEKPGLEIRIRAETVFDKCMSRQETRPEKLRDLRAVAILERIGSAEARQCLKRLAEGAPEARLTGEAKAALERLARMTKDQ